MYELVWEKIYADIDSAETLAKLGLSLESINNYPKFISKFHNAYGGIYQLKGDYIQAINQYQNGLKINEKIGDLYGQSVMLGNIGSIYIQLQQFEMALKYEKRCLAVLKKLKNEANLGSLYNNLSVIYLSKNDYLLALHYAKLSEQLYTKFNDKNGLTYCIANMAQVYERQNEIEIALEKYKKALDLAIETENTIEIGKINFDIGNIYLNLNKPNESIKYLETALKLSRQAEDFETQSQILENLYKYYKLKNDVKNALKFHEEFIIIKDSINKETKQREINKLELDYEYKQKVAQDSIKMADERYMNSLTLKAKNAQIEKDKTQRLAMIVFIALLLIVSFVIFNRFKITQKQKQIIEIKNKQTEEQKLIIEEKQKEIVDSINYAKRIQDSLLDNFDSVSKFFSDSFIFNKPKDIVSGDFYWISKKLLNEEKNGNSTVVNEMFFIAVCDSTGHGVPGGFMSLLNMAYLSEAINEKNILEPNKIFDYVRDRLINTISKNDQKDGFDGVLLRFDKRFTFNDKQLVNIEIELSYSAAHNAPILIKDNQLQELPTDKMPVGYGEKTENFKIYTQQLKKDDVIFIYTDGYADQFGGPKGKKFKYKQLNELLLSISQLPMNQQASLLSQQFEDWKGNNEQIDDVCVIGIRI